MMDELIERLSRECAEALVSIDEFAPNAARPHETWPWLWLLGHPLAELALACESTRLDVPAIGGVLRAELTKAVAAALRRFALTPPYPSPVSEERLAQLQRMAGQWVELAAGRSHGIHGIYEEGRDSNRDWLAHVLHLTRLAQAMSAESEGETYAAGYDAGKDRQRQEVLETIHAHVATLAGHPDRAAVAYHLGAVAARIMVLKGAGEGGDP